MRLTFPIELQLREPRSADARRAVHDHVNERAPDSQEGLRFFAADRSSPAPSWCSAPEFCDFLGASDLFPPPPNAA
jgi:hypothetical protein